MLMMPTKGSLTSDELTHGQKKYQEILALLGQTATIVSEKKAVYKIERKHGFHKMMQAIQNDEKKWETLTAEEREYYENEYRFDVVSNNKVGNPMIFLQQLLHEAHCNQEIRKIVDEYMKDIVQIANKETTEFFKEQDSHKYV